VDESFQFGLYQASQNDVLPAIQSKLTTLAPCTGTTTAAYRTCAMTFVTATGAKAFRRPLETAEVTNLLGVYDAGAGTGTTVDYPTGISLVIQAMITSPSFIYKTELGPTTLAADASGKYPDTTLNPYEIASQLGFLFLGLAARRRADRGRRRRQPGDDSGADRAESTGCSRCPPSRPT
jgi:hypothetical protein